MRPLGTKKITQPLKTNKNHATIWDKEIMHYFGTKIITQPLEKEKKVTQPLGQKEITQPLGTKKITQPLGGKQK